MVGYAKRIMSQLTLLLTPQSLDEIRCTFWNQYHKIELNLTTQKTALHNIVLFTVILTVQFILSRAIYLNSYATRVIF